MEGSGSGSGSDNNSTATNGVGGGGGGGHGGGGGSGNSRWNPTKEQISMLENLYKQGVRTPSADQIQQITTRLKAFGHIEGKNVFYWFQNHKARQRQKQKQESLASFNRFLHKPPTPPHHVFGPPFLPPSPNGFCGPYYVPQNDMGYYQQQCPKMLLPSGIKRRLSPKIDGSGGGYEQTVSYNTSSYGHDISMHTAENITTGGNCNSSSNHQETLALFPMHPTGILQGRRSNFTDQNSSNSNSTEDCSVGGGQTGFFDFFSAGHGSFVSD